MNRNSTFFNTLREKPGGARLEILKFGTSLGAAGGKADTSETPDGGHRNHRQQVLACTECRLFNLNLGGNADLFVLSIFYYLGRFLIARRTYYEITKFGRP